MDFVGNVGGTPSPINTLTLFLFFVHTFIGKIEHYYFSISMHMQLRKVSKTKTVFPTDDSLLKILYLATIGVSKKWTVPIREWPLILGQLVIHFSDRI